MADELQDRVIAGGIILAWAGAGALLIWYVAKSASEAAFRAAVHGAARRMRR